MYNSEATNIAGGGVPAAAKEEEHAAEEDGATEEWVFPVAGAGYAFRRACLVSSICMPTYLFYFIQTQVFITIVFD